MEIKVTEDQEIFNRIKYLITKFQDISDQLNSYNLLIERIILKSKLELIEFNIEEALSLLQQPLKICEDIGLKKLEVKVNQEISTLTSEIEKWKVLIDSNAPIFEWMEASRVMDYLHTISKTRINSNYPEQHTNLFSQQVEKERFSDNPNMINLFVFLFLFLEFRS